MRRPHSDRIKALRSSISENPPNFYEMSEFDPLPDLPQAANANLTLSPVLGQGVLHNLCENSNSTPSNLLSIYASPMYNPTSHGLCTLGTRQPAICLQDASFLDRYVNMMGNSIYNTQFERISPTLQQRLMERFGA